jgi:hypothetical protein
MFGWQDRPCTNLHVCIDGLARKVNLAVARAERSPLGWTNRIGSAFPTCARAPPVVLCMLHFGAHGASGPRGQAVHPGGMLDFFFNFLYGLNIISTNRVLIFI